jgi:hypothetical protein
MKAHFAIFLQEFVDKYFFNRRMAAEHVHGARHQEKHGRGGDQHTNTDSDQHKQPSEAIRK